MSIKVASVEQTRRIEAEVDASLFSYAQMMLKAGRAASALLQDKLAINERTRVTFLIGKGNNGGDGLVMALDLARKSSAQIHLYLLETRGVGDAHMASAREAGLFITTVADDPNLRQLKSLIASSDIIVDALFGIGLRLPLRAAPVEILCAVNQALELRSSSAEELDISRAAGSVDARPYVFAIDCPSGVDCDTGAVDLNTITADDTITFIAAKKGLFEFPAARYTGELTVARIGIPDSLPTLKSINTDALDSKAARDLLPVRPIDGHKGTFGKLMVVAGSRSYIGALALAAESAYRSGVGLVTVATIPELISIVASALREPTYLPLPNVDGAVDESACHTVIAHSHGYQALLIGCGLGRHRATHAFVMKLLEASELPPMIVDADALNILSETSSWWRKLPADTVITPHIGEMTRLTGLSTDEIKANRWELAAECAAKWNVILVLKGAHTLVAAPDGRVAVIPIKSDALGTAGTGDVLAGLIAGLRAGGMEAYDCARLGAYVHALAGLVAAEQVGSSRSVVAGDVLGALGRAFQTVEAPHSSSLRR